VTLKLALRPLRPCFGQHRTCECNGLTMYAMHFTSIVGVVGYLGGAYVTEACAALCKPFTRRAGSRSNPYFSRMPTTVWTRK
jgi:hypothetical protein